MLEKIAERMLQKSEVVRIISKYLALNKEDREKAKVDHKKTLDLAFLSYGFYKKDFDKEFVERVGYYLEGIKQSKSFNP